MATTYITNPGGTLATDWTTVDSGLKHYKRNNFQIKAPNYNGTSQFLIHRILNGQGGSGDSSANIASALSTDSWQIKHNTLAGSNRLQIWFDLSNSYVLSQLKLTNNKTIAPGGINFKPVTLNAGVIL